ncbi:flavodoxin family protein [uncultured Methanobacterium sp.]|uniref:flavodoxin family protein n=1 Tax=uncultured Methanobacterium sp. TaxID=176306 RepID=UPI002AA63CC0|nr:flavodoxin family protein [uncultured Methanobacterium sp.]
MKTAIVYKSVHHQNTKKVAEVISNCLEGDMFDLNDFHPQKIQEYDLIGFGSGIYYNKPHKSMRNILKGLDKVTGKDAFTFITSGDGRPNNWLSKQLTEKGFNILASFNCKGFDTVGPFKLIGGLNKGHPNEDDLLRAEAFAKQVKESKL